MTPPSLLEKIAEPVTDHHTGSNGQDDEEPRDPIVDLQRQVPADIVHLPPPIALRVCSCILGGEGAAVTPSFARAAHERDPGEESTAFRRSAACPTAPEVPACPAEDAGKRGTMAPTAGLEPATARLGGGCSVH